ncbi:MAG TPA: SDR family oxidoreductase [Polyangia bacterium]|nr:SDR family oxidoreductase [Polyangia bacterium]
MPVRRLEGKVAVVTGASSGVGRAIVRAFADEGCSVALVARSSEALAVAAEEVRARGARALAFAIDVSVAHAVDQAADEVVREWGGIDVWVNDAMVSVFSPVKEMTADEFRRVTEVDYLGYVHGTLAALRHMRAKDRGVIMQIGSALAYRSIPLQSAYCGAKAAIRAFTDSLRSELIHEGSGVAVTMLQLPAVNTPQFEVVRNRLPEHPQPIPPIFQPEVIARAAVEAALRPRREFWVGWSAKRAIVGQRLVPGLLDRYLARYAWRAQETDDLPVGHPPRHANDNVDAPLPGDPGAHGPFDERARASLGARAWAQAHRGWLGLAALSLAGVAAWRPLRRLIAA